MFGLVFSLYDVWENRDGILYIDSEEVKPGFQPLNEISSEKYCDKFGIFFSMIK